MKNDLPLCPSCLLPLETSSSFCPRCNAPVAAISVTDPIRSINAEGEFYRRASRKPRLIGVVAMWLIFSPGIVVVPLWMRLEGSASPFGILLLGSLFVFVLVIPIFVTWRYMKRRATDRA